MSDYWKEWEKKVKDYEHEMDSKKEAKDKNVEYYHKDYEAFRR